MRAYVSIGVDVHELHGPLATCLRCIAEHLPGGTRETLDRIARLDRERAPGKHAFACGEFFALVAAAYGLLADPPVVVRKARRVPEGPMPAAERIGVLVAWLRVRRGDNPIVVYDLYSSTAS